MACRYYHSVQIGTFTLTFYGRDDRYVKRAVVRWLLCFWERAKARQRSQYPGSMAVAIDDGWHQPPEIKIGRWTLGAGDVIPCAKPDIIVDFHAEPNVLKGFCQTFR